MGVIQMSSSTYEIEAPKQCRFCGEQLPTKRTAYQNEYVDFTAALDHFTENPACAAQLAGREPVDIPAVEGDAV